MINFISTVLIFPETSSHTKTLKTLQQIIQEKKKVTEVIKAKPEMQGNVFV